MKRALIFIYGITSYALFFIAFLYSIGFIGNFLTPTSLDGPATMSFGPALAINLGLLAFFALQHSGMARPAFKRWLTRYIPEAAERSTYILMSTVAYCALLGLWQPMGGEVWTVESSTFATILIGLYLASWLLLLYSTFLINHFDLFGLRQVWYALLGRDTPTLKFVTPTLYRIVRHPIYVGWLGILWFTPTMTVTHLLLAIGTSIYTLAAIKLEERDLIAAHPEYAQYKRKVPALVPSFNRHLNASADAQTA